MSATISLKQSRRPDAAFTLVQHSLVIAGLLLALGLINAVASHVSNSPSGATLKSALADFSVLAEAPETVVTAPASTVLANGMALTPLSPRMQGALDYVKRRYHVSAEALLPVFEVAQLIGEERRIDPLLVVAVIGVESGFNPFAESAMGAQGLMQIIPRWHKDKMPDGAGEKPLLDPVINITVGVHVLEEAIRRGGGLVAGLQYYAGALDNEDTSYANKVLAEKERLEQAARRGPRSSA
jgi:soluble lytic murein transglycosylase-like protein